MCNVKIELNYKAIGDFLKSGEVARFCEQEAERLTRATGMDYKTETYCAETRVVSETTPSK